MPASMKTIGPRAEALAVETLPPETRLFTEGEAAQVMRLSSRTLQRMRAEGGGPRFVRLTSTRIAYRLSDIRKWLDYASTLPGDHRARA